MLSMLRRRLRIGIGGMMLAILLFGLWLGNRSLRQRAADCRGSHQGG